MSSYLSHCSHRFTIDWRTGIPKLARNRRLVISFICTIANYEYGFYYHFYLDGTIEVEVKLTGVVSTGALSYDEQAATGSRKYGINLGGCLYTPAHQHFFVARMDFLVDGKANSITEWNARVEVRKHIHHSLPTPLLRSYDNVRMTRPPLIPTLTPSTTMRLLSPRRRKQCATVMPMEEGSGRCSILMSRIRLEDTLPTNSFQQTQLNLLLA